MCRSKRPFATVYVAVAEVWVRTFVTSTLAAALDGVMMFEGCGYLYAVVPVDETVRGTERRLPLG
jgi:hypothetical protein